MFPTVPPAFTCRQPVAWHTHQLACRLAFKPEALAAQRNGIANGPYFLRTHCHPEDVHLQSLCRSARNCWQDTTKPVSLDCTVALPTRSSQPATHIALTFCVDHLRHPSHQLATVFTGLDIRSLTRGTRLDGSDIVLNQLIPTDNTSASPVLPRLLHAEHIRVKSYLQSRLFSFVALCTLLLGAGGSHAGSMDAAKTTRHHLFVPPAAFIDLNKRFFKSVTCCFVLTR